MYSGPLTLVWEKGLGKAVPWLSDPHHSLEYGLGIQKQFLLAAFPSASLAIPRRLWGQLAAGCSRGNNSSLHPILPGKPPTPRGDMTERRKMSHQRSSQPQTLPQAFYGLRWELVLQAGPQETVASEIPHPLSNPITSH